MSPRKASAKQGDAARKVLAATRLAKSGKSHLGEFCDVIGEDGGAGVGHRHSRLSITEVVDDGTSNVCLSVVDAVGKRKGRGSAFSNHTATTVRITGGCGCLVCVNFVHDFLTVTKGDDGYGEKGQGM